MSDAKTYEAKISTLGDSIAGLTLKEAVETAEREVLQAPEVRYFIDFIKNSKRGIPRK